MPIQRLRFVAIEATLTHVFPEPEKIPVELYLSSGSASKDGHTARVQLQQAHQLLQPHRGYDGQGLQDDKLTSSLLNEIICRIPDADPALRFVAIPDTRVPRTREVFSQAVP